MPILESTWHSANQSIGLFQVRNLSVHEYVSMQLLKVTFIELFSISFVYVLGVVFPLMAISASLYL